MYSKTGGVTKSAGQSSQELSKVQEYKSISCGETESIPLLLPCSSISDDVDDSIEHLPVLLTRLLISYSALQARRNKWSIEYNSSTCITMS